MTAAVAQAPSPPTGSQQHRPLHARQDTLRLDASAAQNAQARQRSDNCFADASGSFDERTVSYSRAPHDLLERGQKLAARRMTSAVAFDVNVSTSPVQHHQGV
jgi:hypothetical protein